MKILLLGANGQLGSDIVLRHQSEFNNTFELIQWTRADVDVSKLEILESKLDSMDFDALINCTSFHKTEEVEQNAAQAFSINAHAVAIMAKACERKKARFVHISTDYVFGYHVLNRPLVETDCANPLNVYGASKLNGEALAHYFCQNSIILRVASLFGLSGSTAKGGNFVTTMLRLGKEKKELTVVNDQFMSPTWTYDIAGAIFSLIKNKAASGVYHTVCSGAASWYDFAKTIFALAEYDVQVKPVSATQFPSKVVRPSYSVLNNTKLNQAIGYVMPDWRDSLSAWFLLKNTAVTT